MLICLIPMSIRKLPPFLVPVVMRVFHTYSPHIGASAAGLCTPRHCVAFRFGGEGGGFTPVVNFSKYATEGRNPVPVFVTLDHCWIYALANKKRVAAVYLEEIPNAVKIIDCHGFARGVKLIGVSPKLDLEKILTPANKTLFNFTFHGNVFDYGGIPEEMLPFTNVLPEATGEE